MGLPDRFAGAMGAILGPGFPGRLTLAVSGGADSMAMLHLAAGWARVWGVGVNVVTVDHGLRPEAADEARMVADEARGLGLSHETLHWTWDGQGNKADAARQGRLAAIGGWDGRADHVLMAHSRDDQAETLLMRLARGSGVDGLSAMAPLRRVGGWSLVRPLLDTGRAELRQYCEVLRIPFVDDPSNADPASARVRMRSLIGQEGLDTGRLTGTARRMARARRALELRAVAVARDLVREGAPGALEIDRDGFAAIEEETRLRLLSGALRWIASAPYGAREGALEDALDRVDGGATVSLGGCLAIPRGGRLWLCREPAAVAETVAPVGTLWDGRWRVTGSQGEVRALGEAGVRRQGRPDHPAPVQVWQALPAVDGLSPLLGPGPRSATLEPPAGPFPASLLSH